MSVAMNTRALEGRVRRRAYSLGYRVCKSRRYSPPDMWGEYMVIDPSTRGSVFGHAYDASLDEIEKWLSDQNE